MTQPQREKRPRRAGPKTSANPLVKGILAFCQRLGIAILDSPTQVEFTGAAALDEGWRPDVVSPADSSVSSSTTGRWLCRSDLPKRYTAYPPLLLLPVNLPTHSPRWEAFYGALSDAARLELFACIAEEGFAGMGISRVGINAPIAADASPSLDAARPKPNVVRSPSGLVPVYGDWGPRPDRLDQRRVEEPTRQDFDQAFWTSTSQHKGITQCWAPLYTMFSRGNISEKARILDLAPPAPAGERSRPANTAVALAPGSDTDAATATAMATSPNFSGLTALELGEPASAIDIVDLYIGIGYFAFCYLARGVRRVWGWDMNPWSIEGLRRGCERNGWACVAVTVDDTGNLTEGTERDLVERIVAGDLQGQGPDPDSDSAGQVRCVAFLGDNKWAGKVMAAIEHELESHRRPLNVRHANLGLLPTSRGSWENAVKVMLGQNPQGKGGWLHVHENVDVRQTETMKREIVRDVDKIVQEESQGSRSTAQPAWSVSCPRVEPVKTYAPGVMHCVFDIQIMSRA